VRELAGLSAVEQNRLLNRREVSGDELREAAAAACERLDPQLHFLVTPLFEQGGMGVPMLLKDAGQEIAGVPHHVGVAARLRTDPQPVGPVPFGRRLQRRLGRGGGRRRRRADGGFAGIDRRE
jgi:Asp-tRNA(Asn)/Glu-tRNA(Gln) amidotransferase A subunit family amidase